MIPSSVNLPSSAVCQLLSFVSQAGEIAHPFKAYNYPNVTLDLSKSFQMFVLMKTSKYLSFPESDRTQIEVLASLGSIELRDVEIKSPNNATQTIAGKLIIYEIS